jgi:hypothetical protein
MEMSGQIKAPATLPTVLICQETRRVQNSLHAVEKKKIPFSGIKHLSSSVYTVNLMSDEHDCSESSTTSEIAVCCLFSTGLENFNWFKLVKVHNIVGYSQ